MLKYLHTLRWRYRNWRKGRAWERSPRRAELDTECDLPPRLLTPEEDQLLRWVLEHGTDFAKSFLPQMEGIRATRGCACGCPSISLIVAEDAPLGRFEPGRLVIDLLGNTAKEELVGLLVFQAGGKLSGLEVYPLDEKIIDFDKEFGLPTPESLHDFKQQTASAEQGLKSPE
jgi:hypothetical protein